jgi:hypothetical protein
MNVEGTGRLGKMAGRLRAIHSEAARCTCQTERVTWVLFLRCTASALLVQQFKLTDYEDLRTGAGAMVLKADTP